MRIIILFTMKEIQQQNQNKISKSVKLNNLPE